MPDQDKVGKHILGKLFHTRVAFSQNLELLGTPLDIACKETKVQNHICSNQWPPEHLKISSENHGLTTTNLPVIPAILGDLII